MPKGRENKSRFIYKKRNPSSSFKNTYLLCLCFQGNSPITWFSKCENSLVYINLWIWFICLTMFTLHVHGFKSRPNIIIYPLFSLDFGEIKIKKKL